MHKVEAIAKLERRAKAIKALGATSLYLFGSVVRNEAKAASDLDLFIDYDRDSRFNAFHLVRIKQYLEGELGLDVDVTTRDGLHPMLRSEIEQSAVRVLLMVRKVRTDLWQENHPVAANRLPIGGLCWGAKG